MHGNKLPVIRRIAVKIRPPMLMEMKPGSLVEMVSAEDEGHGQRRPDQTKAQRRGVQVEQQETSEEHLFAKGGGDTQRGEPATFDPGRGQEKAQWHKLGRLQKGAFPVFDADLDEGRDQLNQHNQ